MTTPIFQIILDDKDITERVRDRLISLTITDQRGLKDDSLELVIDDRQPYVSFPRKGSEIRISIGYKEKEMVGKGLFIVDEVIPSGPPEQLTITASAANFSGKATKNQIAETLRSQKSRSWHQVKLGAIVETIAKEHGYQPVISKQFASMDIKHIDQTDESDLNFLTRLGERFGATVKAANGRIVFAEKGKGESASGKALKTFSLLKSDFESWDVAFPQRDKFNSIKAFWHDTDAAVRKSVKVGDGNPIKTISRTFASEEEAEGAARAELGRSDRSKAILSATIKGIAAMTAEATIKLTDFRPEVNQSYVIENIQHVIMKNMGYICTVRAEGKS